MCDLDFDQVLTNIWLRCDQPHGQMFSKRYTTKSLSLDYPLTKIRLRILGLLSVSKETHIYASTRDTNTNDMWLDILYFWVCIGILTQLPSNI